MQLRFSKQYQGVAGSPEKQQTFKQRFDKQ